jgi:hypothetical protein
METFKYSFVTIYSEVTVLWGWLRGRFSGVLTLYAGLELFLLSLKEKRVVLVYKS